jgi:CRISPR-associated protein Cmr2
LYAGSQILSEMIKAAAKEAKCNQKIHLIFPNSVVGKSFPNRFLGKIEGDFTEEDLQKKGDDIKNAVIKKFSDFAKDALKKVNLSNNIPDYFWKQINNHWDINWLFYPYEEGKYEAAYEEIEPLMAALKNQREIKNDFVEAGRKCSLDGQNNALFRGTGTKNGILIKQAVEVNNAWLNPNEGLSAISLVKRAYNDNTGKDFSSTIEVALKKQILFLEKTKTINIIECYKKLFSKNFVDAIISLAPQNYLNNVKIENTKEDWLFDFNEEFLIEDNLTQKNIPNLTQLQIVKDLHSKNLKSVLKDHYYALIAFDADKMGKLLSGETRKDKTSDLEIFQSKVSGLLAKYSNWIYTAKELKDKIDVVYAGGDDFLGFVNLHDLFEVGRVLRSEFDKQINQQLKDEIDGDFTFSMGVTIAHYKTPLSIVLQTTRDMEKLAKNENKGNRNAFAIAVLKHSGENHKAYYKWGVKDDKETYTTWKALETLIGHLQNDCSDTFIRVLEREFLSLQDKNGQVANPKMIKTELRRLASKSLNNDKKSETDNLTNQTWKLFPVEKEEQEIEEKKVHVSNAISAMKITLFLKRQTSKVN